MRVSIAQLTDDVHKALRHYGYSAQEIKTIADILLFAQFRGNNQGIAKLIGAGLPRDPAAGQIEISKESRLSALLNGNKNAGMVVLARATEMCVDKAQQSGFAIVGTYNTASSTGAIGYYAAKIARADLVGFVFAGSPETVPPHGSYEPLFGTNPLAIGAPSDEGPVVLDMATAAMPYYGLVEAKAAGKQIPDNTAYDAQGHLTTDPAQAMDGAILPFDRSYKGAGLAFMVELLTGPLVNAAFVGIGDSWGNWGNLVMAIDPGLLVDRREFKSKVSAARQRVKAAKKLPGIDEIYVPGEKGDCLATERLAGGEIEVEDGLYAALKTVIGEQIDMPRHRADV